MNTPDKCLLTPNYFTDFCRLHTLVESIAFCFEFGLEVADSTLEELVDRVGSFGTYYNENPTKLMMNHERYEKLDQTIKDKFFEKGGYLHVTKFGKDKE